MSQLSQLNLSNPNPFAPASPQAPPIPPLSPQDEQTLLEKLGSAGLGGLSFIGGILNKPGRVIRGALGGHFDELGNLIPFSDALGITNPEREVRGSHLLHNAGLTDEADPSLFSPAGAAGFAADVLTDPLTYLSFGGHALSKAGLLAKKAGTLPATIGERAAQGLGGHVGVGLPFAGNAATFDLAPAGRAINAGVRALPGGNAIADLTGSVAQGAGNLYNSTIPPLFQRAVRGQTDPIAQAAARKATERLPGAQEAARRAVGELTGQLPSVASGGAPTLAESRQLRTALETPGVPTGPMAKLVEGQRAIQDADLARANYLGHPDLPLVDPEVAYAKRSLVYGDNPILSPGQGLRPKGPEPGRTLPKGIPTEGSPGSINELSRNPSLVPLRQQYNAGEKQPWLDYAKKANGVDQSQLDALRAQSQLHNPAFQGTPFPHAEKLASMEAKAKAAENLADWIATSVPESLALGKEPLGAFDVHPHLDLANKTVKSAARFLDTEALHESIAGMAHLGEDGAPLSEVLTKAGLTYKDANGNMTAMARTLEAMQARGRLPANASLADLADWTIPHDQVDRLTKFVKASTSPAGLAPFLRIWDSITNLTKTFQTAIWPANIARNKGQAAFQNWMIDGFNAHAPTGMGYVKPYIDASAWYKGQTIEGSSLYPAFKHLNDEQATQQINSIIQNLNVATAFKNPEADIVGGDVALRQLLPTVAGQAQKPIKDILSGAIPHSLEEAHPLNIAGFNGRTEDTASYVRASREFSQASHAQDRVATFLAKLSQGYTPEAALKEVKLAHYDFANMTGFEKDVMKRVVPFYNFARQNVPAVLNEIFENPGGKLATTLKAVNEAKGAHPGFLPSQISGGLAAPIGPEDNGQQRYLTHLGLGFEDLGNLAGPGGPLGMLNPLIKAPIESITGKQLISGRDLADLHSRISDTTGITPPPLLENLLMNSPVGRLATTSSTLSDPRKSIMDKLLNVGTGVRVSDVDVDASRRRAVLDAITSQLHGPGVRRFESLSVKPEDFAAMDPLSQHLYQLYRSLQKKGAQVPALP